MTEFKTGDWALIAYCWTATYKAFVPDLVKRDGSKIPFRITRVQPAHSAQQLLFVDFSNDHGHGWSYYSATADPYILVDPPCEFCGCFCFQTCRKFQCLRRKFQCLR